MDSIITLLKIIGIGVIYAVIMSAGMVLVFIPASHLFAFFFEAFSPPPAAAVWLKVGTSVFLPINFILNMFVYMQRRLKAWIDSL